MTARAQIQPEDKFSEGYYWKVATWMNIMEMERRCRPIWRIDSADVN
jgi:hypothetical protein